MDLSKQVFCAGMLYVALSRVKQMQNLHLIAFDEDAIKVSGKSLMEVNRLRETYRPDLPQYSVPREKKGTVRVRKHKMSGSLSKALPSLEKVKTREEAKFPQPQVNVSLKQETAGSKRKLKLANEKSEPSPKKSTVSPTEGRELEHSDEKSETLTKESLQSPTEGRRDVSSQQRYNPVSVECQRQACQHLGMQFVRANGSTPGGSDVPLTFPARCRTIEGDGNCLFRALSHAITGSERQHSRLRSATVEHMRSLRLSGLNQSLEANVLGLSVEEHLARTRMD